jgi:hypothetical protein
MAIRLIAKRYLVKLLLWIVINPANNAVACGLSEYVSPTHPADTMTLPVILAAWGCFRGVEGGKDCCQAMCHLLRPGIRPTMGAHRIRQIIGSPICQWGHWGLGGSTPVQRPNTSQRRSQRHMQHMLLVQTPPGFADQRHRICSNVDSHLLANFHVQIAGGRADVAE